MGLSACTKSPDLISVDELVAVTWTTALSGTIDKPSHLANDRVYLFSGSLDSVVDPGVVKKLAQYYTHFVTKREIYSMFSITAEHAMVHSIIKSGNALLVLYNRLLFQNLFQNLCKSDE